MARPVSCRAARRAASWAALQHARLRTRLREAALRLKYGSACGFVGLPIKLLIRAGVRLLIRSRFHAKLA
eukprot:13498483-Heterocapsa_arctica.AAC.1